MNEPKRHHFVPELLLSRFADESGLIHLFDKRRPEKSVISTNPINVFVERHLYSQTNDDGTKDVSVERFFSALESEVSTIIEKIVVAARTKTVPNLTADELTVWVRFFYLQWKRVPDVHDMVFDQAEYDEYVDELIEEYQSTVKPLTALEHGQVNDPGFRVQLWKDARAIAASRPSDEVEKLLLDKGLIVARISNPKRSFVIGSHPIVKLTKDGRNHLSDPSVQMWLPLSFDVAVTPCGARGAEGFVEFTEMADVRYLNERIFAQSTAIAGRSVPLVKSLARVR